MKLGVVGIVITKDRSVSQTVNDILSAYGDIIVGRMGVPNKTEQVYVISLIVKGSLEEISALTGKLGKLKNVKVKSAVTDIGE